MSISAKGESSSSSSSLTLTKRKKHQVVSRLLSRVVLPLILLLFVSDIVFYETNETKLQREAKKEEERVGSHKIDVHQHSRLVKDGKPEEIAEIHTTTTMSGDEENKRSREESDERYGPEEEEGKKGKKEQ